MEDHRKQRFDEIDVSGSHFHGIVLEDVTVTDSILDGVEISGIVRGLTVNGIEVAGYVEAELDRLHPERPLLRAEDPDGLRQGWEIVVAAATATIERARALPPAALDDRVQGEWSFLETQRHLVFATDRWIRGPVLGEAAPFHPMGRPNDPVDEVPADLVDLDARPSLDEVVAVRQQGWQAVASILAAATAEELAREVPGPYGGTTTVLRCLHVVLREEWWHDRYANRDLAAIEVSRAAR